MTTIAHGYMALSVLDRNDDHLLDAHELSAKTVAKLDTDGDGFVNKAELDALELSNAQASTITMANARFYKGRQRENQAPLTALSAALTSLGIGGAATVVTAIVSIILAFVLSPWALVAIPIALGLAIAAPFVTDPVSEKLEKCAGQHEQNEAREDMKKAWDDVAAARPMPPAPHARVGVGLRAVG